MLERIILTIVIGIGVRVVIGLIRRAFSPSLPPGPAAPPVLSAAGVDEIRAELEAVCRAPEHGTLLLRGIRGAGLQIDGVDIDLDGSASAKADYRAAGSGEAVSIENVCPGRHSIRGANERGAFALALLLQPHEDAARTLTATGWYEPEERAVGDASVLDYAEVVAPKMVVRGLAAPRLERALDIFASAAGIVTETAVPGDPALALFRREMEAELDGAPLTQEAFTSFVGRVSLAIEQRAHRGESFAPAAQLAQVALAVLPDDPRLLVRLAELEAALGREEAARGRVARARVRVAALTGIDETLLARADAVIRECDAG